MVHIEIYTRIQSTENHFELRQTPSKYDMEPQVGLLCKMIIATLLDYSEMYLEYSLAEF